MFCSGVLFEMASCFLAASLLQSLLLAEPQAQIRPIRKIKSHSHSQCQGGGGAEGVPIPSIFRERIRDRSRVGLWQSDTQSELQPCSARLSSTEVRFWSILDAGMKCDRKCETPANQGILSAIKIAWVQKTPKIGRTPRGSCNDAPSKKVLRRVLDTAFEKVLRRVLRRCLAVCFRGKKGSEKGSEKGS